MALTARMVLKMCPFPVGGRPHHKRGLPKGRLHWQTEGTVQPHWQRESREYCSEQLHWLREVQGQPRWQREPREYCSEQLHWQRERQPVERGPRPTWQPMATSASQRSAEAR